MRADRASVWYRRMSVVYAVGAWSVVGSVYLFTRKQKVSGHEVGQEDGSRNETPVSTSQDPIS